MCLRLVTGLMAVRTEEFDNTRFNKQLKFIRKLSKWTTAEGQQQMCHPLPSPSTLFAMLSNGNCLSALTATLGKKVSDGSSDTVTTAELMETQATMTAVKESISKCTEQTGDSVVIIDGSFVAEGLKEAETVFQRAFDIVSKQYIKDFINDDGADNTIQLSSVGRGGADGASWKADLPLTATPTEVHAHYEKTLKVTVDATPLKEHCKGKWDKLEVLMNLEQAVGLTAERSEEFNSFYELLEESSATAVEASVLYGTMKLKNNCPAARKFMKPHDAFANEHGGVINKLSPGVKEILTRAATMNNCFEWNYSTLVNTVTGVKDTTRCTESAQRAPRLEPNTDF